MYVLSIVPPPLLFKPPESGKPGVVFIVHCVVCTLAVKLPLLCAQALDDPNTANAAMARPGSVTLVIIERFIITLSFSCLPFPEGGKAVSNEGSPETAAPPDR